MWATARHCAVQIRTSTVKGILPQSYTLISVLAIIIIIYIYIPHIVLILNPPLGFNFCHSIIHNYKHYIHFPFLLYCVSVSESTFTPLNVS